MLDLTPINWPRHRWPHFSHAELACRHTGRCFLDPDFMDSLQALRISFDRPMVVSSGYRAPEHPIEAAKVRPGTHAQGVAVDIKVHGQDALDLVALAYTSGFKRIGLNQRGHALLRFVHLDRAPDRPAALWTY